MGGASHALLSRSLWSLQTDQALSEGCGLPVPSALRREASAWAWSAGCEWGCDAPPFSPLTISALTAAGERGSLVNPIAAAAGTQFWSHSRPLLFLLCKEEGEDLPNPVFTSSSLLCDCGSAAASSTPASFLCALAPPHPQPLTYRIVAMITSRWA